MFKKAIIALFLLISFFVFFELLYHSDRGYPFVKNSIGAIVPINKVHDNLSLISSYKKMYFPKEKKTINILMSNNDIKYIDSLINVFLSLGYQSDNLRDWRKAEIVIKKDTVPMKFKLHGTSIAPLLHSKTFSLKIKLIKKGYTLNNMKEFVLMASKEFNPCNIVPQKLAEGLGLISPVGEMTLMKINNKLKGCFYLVENHKKSFFKNKYGISEYLLIKPNDDKNRKERSLGHGHKSDHDLYHGNMEYKGTSNKKGVVARKFDLMVNCLIENKKEQFVEFFNKEYISKFLALLALFNDCHFILGDNLKLVYQFSDNKFYPIYRQEGKGEFPQHSGFVNFNRNIFESLSYPFYGEEKNLMLFKALLSNTEIRKMRDKYLYSFVLDKDKIINTADSIHRSNEDIMLFSNFTQREYYFEKIYQLQLIEKNIQIAKDYLNYGKVFISIDNTNNQLLFRSDCFSSVNCEIYNKNNLLFKKQFEGIDLNNNLTFNYSSDTVFLDSTIDFKNSIFKVTNMTTNTQLKKEDIYITDWSE